MIDSSTESSLSKQIAHHEQQARLAFNRPTRAAHLRRASKYRAALRALQFDDRVANGAQRELEIAQ